MIIVMLGAPGSGKGTASKLLSKLLNEKHISTGDMFREFIKKGDELGKELEKYMSKGLLVPDDLVIRILEQQLSSSECEKGVILDGFPRTANQAISLKEMLEKQEKKVDMALQLDIPDNDIIYRTVKRRMCSNKECGEIYNLEFKKPKVEGICDKCGSKLIQRKDDTEETVKQRLEIYHKNSKEIIEYYEKQGILYTVNLRASDNMTEEKIKEWIEDFKKSV